MKFLPFLLLALIGVARGQNVQGNRMTINGPATITDIRTFPGAQITAAPAMSSPGANQLTINVGLADQVGTVSSNTTLFLSGTPSNNTWFGFTLTADSTARVITLPAGTWYSDVLGTTTSFTIAASQTAYLQVKYDGTRYNLFGNPYSYLDFGTNTTPASTAILLTQNASTGVLQRSTKAQLQADLGTPTTLVLTNATGTPAAINLANATGFPKLDVVQASGYAADAGSTDDYAITLSPAASAYVAGTSYKFKANTVNTGAATLNVNGLGAKTIKKFTAVGGEDLATNDIRAGALVTVGYDGTNMQLLSVLGNAGGGATPGGSDTQIQFNVGGTSLGGDNGFTFNSATDVATLAGGLISNAGNNNFGALFGSDGTRLNVPYTTYAAGTTYSLTNSAAALDFGTTDPVITFTVGGTYQIRGRVNLKYVGATFASNQDVTLKFRRTNNTAADLSNGSTVTTVGVVTTLTNTFEVVPMPEVTYTATAGDTVTIFASVAATPSAGSLQAVEANIAVVRLYE